MFRAFRRLFFISLFVVLSLLLFVGFLRFMGQQQIYTPLQHALMEQPLAEVTSRWQGAQKRVEEKKPLPLLQAYSLFVTKD